MFTPNNSQKELDPLNHQANFKFLKRQREEQDFSPGIMNKKSFHDQIFYYVWNFKHW